MRGKNSIIIIAVFSLCGTAVLFYFISFLLRTSCEWGSNVLISIASGEITGLVLYVLSNARNNLQWSSREEYEQLIAIRDKTHELNVDIKYYQEYGCLYLEEIDFDSFVRQSLVHAYHVYQAICDLPQEVFLEMAKDELDTAWFDFGKIETKYQSMYGIEAEEDQEQYQQLLRSFSELLGQIESRTRNPIQKRRKVLAALSRPF